MCLRGTPVSSGVQESCPCHLLSSYPQEGRKGCPLLPESRGRTEAVGGGTKRLFFRLLCEAGAWLGWDPVLRNQGGPSPHSEHARASPRGRHPGQCPSEQAAAAPGLPSDLGGAGPRGACACLSWLRIPARGHRVPGRPPCRSHLGRVRLNCRPSVWASGSCARLLHLHGGPACPGSPECPLLCVHADVHKRLLSQLYDHVLWPRGGRTVRTPSPSPLGPEHSG